MSERDILISGYDSIRASDYDEESKVDKGNRELHRLFLRNLLLFNNRKPGSFLELGCGTGYFTEVFFEVFPNIRGTLIDGSKEMLEMAKSRFVGNSANLEYKQYRFEDIDWKTVSPQYDIIISPLAIHHLVDDEKWKLFQSIYDRLTPGGWFILYDIFKPKDQLSFEVLEFLTCMDHQQRLKAELEVDFDLEELRVENIIANDRRIKKAEGDKEACLEDQKYHLAKAGFTTVTTIFQDARFAGTIAFKK
jgi:tRNA (cmo5U34)-methyltransferase